MLVQKGDAMESRKERLLPAGRRLFPAVLVILGGVLAVCLAYGQEQGKTSYLKVDITETFASIMARMKAAKPGIEKQHSDLLVERYDLSDRPARGVMMERD